MSILQSLHRGNQIVPEINVYFGVDEYDKFQKDFEAAIQFKPSVAIGKRKQYTMYCSPMFSGKSIQIENLKKHGYKNFKYSGKTKTLYYEK